MSVIGGDLPSASVAQPANQRFELTFGRDLIFGPAWSCSEARVVFDRNSGDYWIVTSIAAEVLAHLSNVNVGTVQQIAGALPEAAEYYDPVATTGAVLGSLVEYDLVRIPAKPISQTPSA